MTNRIQALRSSVTGSVPPNGVRLPGELWVNFPDLQMGMIDAGKNAQKLLGVRNYSITAVYAPGDAVVTGGALYFANTTTTAGAFNPTQWNKVAFHVETVGFLPLAGGTMTGPLTLAGAPVNPLDAATKAYSDLKLPLTGGTLSGALLLSGPPTVANQAATKAYVDSGQFVPMAGGTMTGPLTLSQDPTAVMHAATKQYADTKFPLTGGTLNGNLSALNNYLMAYGVAGTNWLSVNFSPSSTYMVAGNALIMEAYSNAIVLNGYTSGSAGAAIGGATSWNFNIGGGTISSFGCLYVTNVATTANWPPMVQGAAQTGGPLSIWTLMYSGPQNGFRFGNSNGMSTPSMDLTSGTSGIQLWCYGNAYKPGGGSWLDSSDARLKNVEEDFKQGLDEVLKLRPVVYTYRGNDTHDEPGYDEDKIAGADGKMPKRRAVTSAPYPNSPHYHEAVKKNLHIGLIAQEVETIMPQMVKTRPGMINGQSVDDIRDINNSSLIYALVNAVKELSARLEAVEGVVVP